MAEGDRRHEGQHALSAASVADSLATAEVFLIGDGPIADSATAPTIAGRVHYRPVGETAQNLAITRFDVKESFDRPGEYHAFVRVNNFGADGYDVIVFDNCAPKALGAGR